MPEYSLTNARLYEQPAEALNLNRRGLPRRAALSVNKCSPTPAIFCSAGALDRVWPINVHVRGHCE
eukprot:3649516-Prorocentrum_lima.AAC.1